MAILGRNVGLGWTATRKRERANLTVALIAIAVVALYFVMIGASRLSLTNLSPSESPDTARITYVSHAPILIEGNDGFLGDNSSTGITRGSGTESDPYVIEGWQVVGTAPYSKAGIWIRGSDVHFVIQDCEIRDCVGDFTYGILFDDCWNGTVRNNVFSGNNHAVRLGYFSGDPIDFNNKVIHNTCFNNVAGIVATWMGGLEISNNTCRFNDWGIWISVTSDNHVANNTCTDNDFGILALVANDTDLIGNDCSSNNATGIHLYRTNECDLVNNRCSYNNIGVHFRAADWQGSSANNSVDSNWIEGNERYGILIDDGNQNNTIWNNSLVCNNGASGVYDPQHVQALDNGTANWWNCTEGYGNYWSDWAAPDLNLDGIVDTPYDIDGGAGARDYYPRTESAIVPEFGHGTSIVFVVVAMIAVVAGAGRRLRWRDS